MTKAEEYRQRAKECEQMATNTKDPEAKRAFTEAAHQWRHLAAQVERWGNGSAATSGQGRRS